MEKKKIGVLFGGCSPEHNVSLESAYSVITNINREKYDIVLIGITEDGNWYKFNGNAEEIKNNTWENGDCEKAILSCNREDKGIICFKNGNCEKIKLDAIFPVLHGENGEDGSIQGLIKLAGIPLIGCGILASSVGMDKYVSHKLVESYGIKVAKNITIDKSATENEIKEKIKELGYPVFVKPMRAGSSFGITKVEREEQIAKALEEAFKYDTEVIIEENIDGNEIGCAVLGNEKLTVGEVDEIELSDGFFDFTEKYTLKTSKIYVPARISEEKAIEAKEIAKKIYKILKCKDFARVDMFLSKNGEIYFNEINSIPGFTSHSRYPSMMKEVGLDFSSLIEKLIEMNIQKN